MKHNRQICKARIGGETTTQILERQLGRKIRKAEHRHAKRSATVRQS